MKQPHTFLLVLVSGFLTLLFFAHPVTARPEKIQPLPQSSLPTITFLGEGPQTFTIAPPLLFLIKANNGKNFIFVTRDGPTYQAKAQERVWSIDVAPTESFRLFDEGRSYGSVVAGCVVNYVQIEDNVDNRRNSFYINGNLIQTVEQGMVTYGSFTAPVAGELTFFAQDSIGLIVELCQVQVTQAGSPTVLATTVQSSTPSTATLTPPPQTETPTLSPTATFTAVTTITEGATRTTETATATNTPIITPTQTPPNPTTSTNRTAVSTPNQIPVTGGAPGPYEIAWMSLGLLWTGIVLAGAWWLLWRKYRHDK